MDAGSGPRGLSRPCLLIIVVASVERFAFKGVASNLVTFLTEELKMSTSAAAKSVNSWYGVTSMLPLLGAFLADSFWDRYSTILCSSLLYVVGLAGLTSWALLCSWMPGASLFLPLYLISTAQGGYNPTLQAFGADQLGIDDELPETTAGDGKTTKKRQFFQWWYFGICSGSLLGNSLMSYVQDTFGWKLGFAIPTVAMGVSVAFFTCGSRYYVHKQSNVTAVAVPSFKNVTGAIKSIVCGGTSGGGIKLPSKDSETLELELQEKPLQNGFESRRSVIANVRSGNRGGPPSIAKKAILKLAPVWTLLLTFAVIFQLPSTFFTKQGMAMRRDIGGGFMIPPAALQSSITISIIILMPLYDRLLIPLMRAVTRNDRGVSVFQRIGIGMFLSVVAMIVAAVVEARRLEAGTTQLSILWLLPQYILLGVSDVFTVVGMQEFFYAQVPESMKSMGIGLYLSVFGVGSFLGAFLISGIEFVSCQRGFESNWFSDDMGETELYKYYWFLAMLSAASFALFVYLSRCFADIDSEQDGGSPK